MNKWQIIGPIVVLLILGGWAVNNNFQVKERTLQLATEHHLSSVFEELKRHPDSGRLPSIAVASSILSDDEIEKRVHLSSLFGTKDLLYNPAQPTIGSDAEVICVRVGSRLTSIRANGEAHRIGEREFLKVGFVPFAETAQN